MGSSRFRQKRLPNALMLMMNVLNYYMNIDKQDIHLGSGNGHYESWNDARHAKITDESTLYRLPLPMNFLS